MKRWSCCFSGSLANTGAHDRIVGESESSKAVESAAASVVVWDRASRRCKRYVEMRVRWTSDVTSASGSVRRSSGEDADDGVE